MTIKLGQTIAQKMQQFQAPSPQQSNPSVVSGVNVNVKQMIRQIESRQLLKDSVPTKPVAKQAAKTISVISRNEPVTSQVIQRVLIPEIVRSSENLKRSLMTEKLNAIRLEVEGAINEEQEDNELPLAEDGTFLFMTKIKKLTQEKESLSREIENQNVIAKQVQQDILNVMGCPVSVLGIVDQYVYSEAEFSKNIAKLDWANLDIHLCFQYMQETYGVKVDLFSLLNEPVTSQVVQRVLIPEIVRSSENLKRSLMTEKLDAIRLEVEGAINEEQEDNELPLAEDGILLFMTKIKKLTQEKESLSREIENQNVIAKQVQQDILNVMGCPVSVLGIVDQYVYSEAEFSKNIAKLSWANLDIIKKCTKAYYAHPIDHVIS